MPDKKLTDNEIVKALECCANLEACEKCPMGSMEKYDTDTCEHQIMLYSLDLINRQNEYIKKCDNLERIADKTIETQKAEIERLKYNLKAVLDERADHTEAYKEFAERLKATAKANEWNGTICGVDIDNLLKELVGDENDKK